ncbi:MAG: glucokinase [Burkholderiales bacterium]
MRATSLLADIGGTNARFVRVRATGEQVSPLTLPVADFARFEDAILAYLNQTGGADVRHAAIAIANPVDGDFVQMTNHHWSFSIEQLRLVLGFDTLLVVNDFTALAMAIPRLEPTQLLQVGLGRAKSRAMIGLVGPGTGLGVSGLLPMDQRWVALGSEGGHVSFAPTNAVERDIHAVAEAKFGHVSAERLLSGAGIALIYRFFAAVESDITPAEITEAAATGRDEFALKTVDVFLGMLGGFAGNVALTYGALGGVYVGGGIVPRLAWRIADSPFRARFEAKGRFEAYLRDIPTFLIAAENPAFYGVRAILDEALSTRPSNDLLAQIRERLPDLPSAAKQVATYLLAEPNAFVQNATGVLAKRAGVSDPTIMRFCRTFGYDGIPEFKRALAAALTGTIPVRHSTVKRSDSAQQLAIKVLDNTASAVLQMRQQLQGDALNKATILIRQAKRLRLFGIGHSGVTCRDAETRFVRLGYDAQAVTDTALMAPYTGLIQPQDGIILISNSGKISELVTLASAARARGAYALGITHQRSPLAEVCDVVLTVEHSENEGEYVSMISRILQLLMVDIITVGRENASTADAIPTEVFSAAEPTPLPVPQSPQTKVRISHLR